jgi:hypothetical protein
VVCCGDAQVSARADVNVVLVSGGYTSSLVHYVLEYPIKHRVSFTLSGAVVNRYDEATGATVSCFQCVLVT